MRARRAKLAVLVALATVAASHAVMGVLVETRTRLRDPMYGDKAAKLRQRIASKDAPFAVVMLGSSRTGYALRGRRAETHLEAKLNKPAVVFNFGIPAAGPITHRVYFRRLVEDGLKPDLLLLEVLPSMLACQLPKKMLPLEKHWLTPDRLRRSEIDTVTGYGFDGIKARRAWRESVTRPYHTLRHPLMGRVIPGWLPFSRRYDWSRGTDVCGWGTPTDQNITPAKYADGLKRAKGEYAGALAGLRPGGSAAAALRDLLADCRRAGVPVVLVVMPEGRDFQTMYTPDVLSRLRTFLETIRDEFDVEFWNLRNALNQPGRPDRAVFTDSHHVLKTGATEFTDEVARRVTLREGRP